MAKAEAAAKKFRDGLGGGNAPDPFEPYDKEQQKRKRQAPKEGDEIAGAFARAFSKRLDAAFKSLPKAKVDADSSAAQTKLQDVRASLSALSEKRIGIDIDAATALGEVESLKAELDKLAESTDIDIRADATAALTQLDALQRDIYKLADSNPTVTPNADTAEAQARIAELRASLDELQQRRQLGVDLDDGAARTAISSIQSELERLNATSADPKVRLDSAAALTELRAVQAEMSQVSGKSARVNVDADVSGALSAIALVGAALASLPAVTSIAVAVGALGGAFAAAGVGAAGFAAVAVPSMGRINEALKQQETAAGGAGGATKSAGQSAAEAASQALQLEQAERRVADAQKGVKQAQEDLTRARRDAKRAIEDYSLSVRDAALSEEDAALSVEEARQRLAEVQADPDSDALDVERADLAFRQAVQRLDEQSVRTKRLKEDKAEADKKGVEGSDQVRGAQDKLLKSQADLATAQKQLTVLQLQQKAAMEKTGGAAGGAASKMAELSKAERALAKDVKAFQDSYVGWQRSLQPDVFPVIRSGMDLMSTGMKISTPLVRASAGAFDDFLKQANRELKSEQWTSFFDDLTTQAPRAIDGLGDSASNVAGGLAGIVQAFLPFTDTLMDRLEDITQEFENWGQNLKGSPEFDKFIDYVSTQGPKVAEILGNIAEFVGKVMSVGAGAAPAVLDFLVTLSDKLAGLNPGQIEAIATGVGMIFAAVKIGAALKIGALVALAEVLSQMSPGQIQALALAIAGVVVAVKGFQAVTGAAAFFDGLAGGIDKAGKSADGAAGKLGGLSGQLAAGGMAAVVAGAAIAVDTLTDSLSGLNPDIAELSKQVTQFTQQGKPAAEVLNAFGANLDTLAGDMGRSAVWFAPTVGQFENLGDTVRRLSSDNPFAQISSNVAEMASSVTGDLYTMDTGVQRLGNADKTLAQMVQSGNTAEAAKLFDELARQAGLSGGEVDKLKALMPQYSGAVAAAKEATGPTGDALKDMGGSASTAAGNVETLRGALGQLVGLTTNAMTAEIAYKRSLDEAANSIKENGQATSSNTEKGRANRETLIGLAGSANAYRQALIDQGTPLAQVTEKLGAQRTAFINVATQMGFSKSQAKGLADQLGLIPGNVKTDVKTPGGREALDLLKEYQRKLKEVDGMVVSVYTKTIYDSPSGRKAVEAKVRASGGIQSLDGQTNYMAAGGLMVPPPMTRDQATYLPHSNTVFGEAGREAYIPYSSKYRARALSILEQVADDFGLEIMNRRAAKNLSDLSVTIDGTNMQVAGGLQSVMGVLADTMGQAGSLTSSISQVGSSAEQLNAGWLTGSQVLSDSVALTGESVSSSVSALTTSVDYLGSVVAEAAQAAKGSKGSGKGGSSGSTNVPAPGSVKGSSGTPANMVAGHYGTGGYTTGGAGLTNYSRVSAPQQAPRSSFAPAPSGGGGLASASGGAGAAGGGGTSVNFPGAVIRETADVDVLTARIAQVIDSRG